MSGEPYHHLPEQEGPEKWERQRQERAGQVIPVPVGQTVQEFASALAVQVGGDHYKTSAIQPVEYIAANNLNFLEGCIVKRITRWRKKNGIEDLEKIKHEVDLLIEMEKKYPRGVQFPNVAQMAEELKVS